LNKPLNIRYEFLKYSSFTAKGIDDATDWIEVEEAFHNTGFSDSQIHDLMRLTAGKGFSDSQIHDLMRLTAGKSSV
jgi:hypothetical protein